MTSAPINFDDVNASLHLEGVELPNGWHVQERRDDSSGSFSVSYNVVHETGKPGFLKVLDLVSVFGDLDAMQLTLSDYIAERDLVLLCGEHGMSRVVVALDHGMVELDGYMPGLSKVHYIIFERAEADLNRTLDELEATDIGVRLDLLHDLAVGLRQLHVRRIAHQDIKPKNSLVFAAESADPARAKVADLGRAYHASSTSPHDDVLIPGDRSFAPPEQLYGFEQSDPRIRRFAADLYQFGSLICYSFGAITMNGMLSQRLAPEHHWDTFGDGYAQALPYLQDAFGSAVSSLEGSLPPLVVKQILPLIAGLCEPDAIKRGHPRAGRGESQFSLERVISDLNLSSYRNRLGVARTR